MCSTVETSQHWICHNVLSIYSLVVEFLLATISSNKKKNRFNDSFQIVLPYKDSKFAVALIDHVLYVK